MAEEVDKRAWRHSENETPTPEKPHTIRAEGDPASLPSIFVALNEALDSTSSERKPRTLVSRYPHSWEEPIANKLEAEAQHAARPHLIVPFSVLYPSVCFQPP